MLQESSRSRIIASHTVATIGSLFGLGFAWLVFNPVITFLSSGEWPGEFIDGPNLICCCSLVWLPLVIVPISVAADMLLVRELHWRAPSHFPVMAMLYFLSAFMLGLVGMVDLTEPSGLDRAEVINMGSGLVLLAVDFTLWGLAYWSVLRAADRLFSRKRSPRTSDGGQ
jgi:hypothetical protein